MKLILLLFTFSLSLLTFAQNPKTISYQGVARNATGQPIPNQAINIQLSLLATATSTTALYAETHTLTTSGQGLFAVQIGAGTPVTGTYADLDWKAGPKFVKTEIDPTGGNNFTLSTVSPLNAVPFALQAENGDKVVSLTGQGATTVTGTYPNFVIRSKDSVGVYQAGAGLNLTGNTFSGQTDQPLWNANKLQNRPLDAGAPTNKDVIKWNGISWKAGKDSVNTYSSGTGINITPGLNISAKNDDPIWNAAKLQGKNVAGSAPAKEDFLRFDGSKWVPGKTIPFYTTRQRDSIPTSTIPKGYTFYNSNTECLEYYTGSKWLALCGSETTIGDTSVPNDILGEDDYKVRAVGPLDTYPSFIGELNGKLYFWYYVSGFSSPYKVKFGWFDLKTNTISIQNDFQRLTTGSLIAFAFGNEVTFLFEEPAQTRYKRLNFNPLTGSLDSSFITYSNHGWSDISRQMLFVYGQNLVFIEKKDFQRNWYSCNLLTNAYQPMHNPFSDYSGDWNTPLKISNTKMLFTLSSYNSSSGGTYLSFHLPDSTSQQIPTLNSRASNGNILHFIQDYSGTFEAVSRDAYLEGFEVTSGTGTICKRLKFNSNNGALREYQQFYDPNWAFFKVAKRLFAFRQNSPVNGQFDIIELKL